MSDIVKWDPFKEVTGLYEEVDTLFTKFLKNFAEEFNSTRMEETNISLKVLDEGQELIITADVPETVRDSLDVVLREDAVIISGETSVKKQQADGSAYHWSKFTRVCGLPAKVKADSAKVSLENGILSIRTIKA